MPVSTMTAFRNRIEPRSMNRPRLLSRRGIPYHGDLSFVNIFLSFSGAWTGAPGWGSHQAGGVLGQGGSEGDSAVGSNASADIMSASTALPGRRRDGHSP